MLDNNSGNSSWEYRIALFRRLIDHIGKRRIELLFMDREFIGHKWLKWLKNQGIRFCVRVPVHHKITFCHRSSYEPKELLRGNKSYHSSDIVVDTVVVDLHLSYDKNGELFYLIGNIDSRKLKKSYKRRSSVGVFFQALKGRGFNMEKSHLKKLERYQKLFAGVSLAYTICWSVGIGSARTNPVKPKNHGYPQYSVFRRDLNLMRDFL